MTDLTLASLQPYRFKTCLAHYAQELLFAGVTYYERFLMFRHLPPYRVTEIMGLPVHEVSLYFEQEKLVSVSFLLQEMDDVHLKQKIETYLDENATANHIPPTVKSGSALLHYWRDKDFLLGVCLSHGKTMLHISRREPCMFPVYSDRQQA